MSRLFDLFKGLISLALLLGLLVGVPFALLLIVGFPLPTEVPDIDLIRRHIEDGDIPDLFVIKTLAVVVWVVWIQLAVAVLTELFAILRGRAAGRAPVLPAIQLFARTLVAGTALIISALTPTRSAMAAPIAPIEPAPIAQSIAGPVEMNPMVDLSPENAPSFNVDGDRVVADEASGMASGQYETRATDNWWDMAERLLGDGMRWSELRSLNEGKTMLSGETVTNRTETVGGGWLIDVPADAEPSLLVQRSVDAIDVETAAAATAAEVGVDAGTAPVGAEPVVKADEVAVADGPGLLARALKPDVLVYNGPSGATDEGPGVPYQVVEGDNLWDIAERHLGDPFRWPEIYERSNALEQPSGRTITNPNLIMPDEVLWLPSDATEVPSADDDLVRTVIGVTVPATGLEGTGIEDEAGDGASTVDATDLAGLTDAAARAGGDEAEQIVVPPVRAVGDRDGEPEPDPGDPIGDLIQSPAGVGFGVGGFVLATGLLGLLVRTRRIRQAEAEERSVPAPPPMDLIDIETVLRNSADRARTVSVHAAIRSLAGRPIVSGEPLAAPEVVRMSGERIEVVQQGPDPDLPAPWLPTESPALEAAGGRSSAVLPAEFFPDDAGADPRQALHAPTFVTVGGGLMLNLEAIGVLAVEGPIEMSAGLIRSMVHELATGPARRSIDLRVSNWLPGADMHEHVLCSPLDRLADELGSWMEDVELGLTASGYPNVYAMRAAGAAGALAGPKVVFADAADIEALAPILSRAARRSLPLAVVVSGDVASTGLEPTATIRLGDDTLRVEPYGFTAAMQYLDVDLILGAEALVQHARSADLVVRDDEQPTVLPMADIDTDPAQAPTEETPERDIDTELPDERYEVTDQSEPGTGMLIRVLGPVEFDGGPEDLSDEERSLLAFLALVGPSTRQQLSEAVWPERQVTDEEWSSTVERLRSRLGSDFPDGGDDRYRVRSIMTDLGAARRWITQARSMTDERMRNLMQLALSDVRGRPFADVDERHWQWTADHKMAVATQATSMLIDACFDLCDNAYEADDLYLSKWACDIGALIDPLHETIVTRRAQLMMSMGMEAEARAVVEQWEMLYEDAASRIPPFGPRMALDAMKEMAPNVG